jgi:hypothetical protein
LLRQRAKPSAFWVTTWKRWLAQREHCTATPQGEQADLRGIDQVDFR